MTEYVTGKNTTIECPNLEIGNGTIIGNNVTIQVQDRLVIGCNSHIGDGSVIKGRDIQIKREFRAVGQVTIGGGSCFEKRSLLRIGYWGHLGLRSFVNTAERVIIGDEVGIGTDSKLYTHGAYLDVLKGFPSQWGPIEIGSNVWMPHVTVHPNVKIGDNVVIGSHSLVTSDIPSGSLAVGIPCRVIKKKTYPDTQIDRQKIITEILLYYGYNLDKIQFKDKGFSFDGVWFNLDERIVNGNASPKTKQLLHHLRRRGIRFKTEILNGKYKEWNSEF